MRLIPKGRSFLRPNIQVYEIDIFFRNKDFLVTEIIGAMVRLQEVLLKSKVELADSCAIILKNEIKYNIFNYFQ